MPEVCMRGGEEARVDAAVAGFGGMGVAAMDRNEVAYGDEAVALAYYCRRAWSLGIIQPQIRQKLAIKARGYGASLLPLATGETTVTPESWVTPERWVWATPEVKCYQRFFVTPESRAWGWCSSLVAPPE